MSKDFTILFGAPDEPASRCLKLSLRPCRNYSIGFSPRRYENKLSAEQIAFVRRESKPEVTVEEFTQEFNARFGTSLNKFAIRRIRKRLAPGTLMTSQMIGRRLSSPLGREVKRSSGFLMVRTRENSNNIKGDRLKHHVIWERAYGAIPPDHYVCFLDGDKRNFRLDNLLAINKGFLKFLHGKKTPLSILKDPEAAKTLVALQQLERQITCAKKFRDKSKCQNLPPIFEPVGRPGFAY